MTVGQYRQNAMPFSGSTEPQSGVLLFQEEFRAGSGENWAPAPGSQQLPGFQNGSARWSTWNPSGVAPVPPWGSPIVDCNRQAGLLLQNYSPTAEFEWCGVTAPTSPAWDPESESFRATLYTRVGCVDLGPTPVGGFGAVLLSLESLVGGADGMFLALGFKRDDSGLFYASFSKWSDHTTLITEHTAEIGGADVALRMLMVVDPEDGLQAVGQLSTGLGWRTFTDGLLLEREGFSELCVGYGASGVNTPSSQTSGVVCEYIRVFRQTGIEEDLGLVEASLGTDGGRSYP